MRNKELLGNRSLIQIWSLNLSVIRGLSEGSLFRRKAVTCIDAVTFNDIID